MHDDETHNAPYITRNTRWWWRHDRLNRYQDHKAEREPFNPYYDSSEFYVGNLKTSKSQLTKGGVYQGPDGKLYHHYYFRWYATAFAPFVYVDVRAEVREDFEDIGPSHMCIDYILVRKAYRHMHYGSQAVQAVIDRFGYVKYANVYADDKVLLDIYKKAGYICMKKRRTPLFPSKPITLIR